MTTAAEDLIALRAAIRVLDDATAVYDALGRIGKGTPARRAARLAEEEAQRLVIEAARACTSDHD